MSKKPEHIQQKYKKSKLKEERKETTRENGTRREEDFKT